MRSDTEKVFYSKVDKWLIAVLALGFIAYIPIFLSKDLFLISLSTLFGMVIFGLVFHSVFYCKYIFEKDYLYIRAGIFVFVKIPYKSIKEFHDSRCLLSAPASSIDRIKIIYGDKKYGIQPFTLVSPRNKALFKETLKNKMVQANFESI